MNFTKRGIVVVAALLVFTLSGCTNQKTEQEDSYHNATLDAMVVEENEVFPLVSLTKEDKNITWNEDGTKVLFATSHKFPESYVNGSQVTLEWGEVWSVSDKEMENWVSSEGKGITDWTKRFMQLLGMPQDNEHTHITTFWVSPEDTLRPAYVSDVRSGTMKTTFDDRVDPEYKEWFDGNIVYSYFDSEFPWTRLGYTYDWGNSDDEYGLSEFLVEKGASVEVVKTQTHEEYAKAILAK